MGFTLFVMHWHGEPTNDFAMDLFWWKLVNDWIGAVGVVVAAVGVIVVVVIVVFNFVLSFTPVALSVCAAAFRFSPPPSVLAS